MSFEEDKDLDRGTPDTNAVTRRGFLQTAAGVVAGAAASRLILPYSARAQDTPTTQKLRIAFVGTGGQAWAHQHLAREENCVAICDVDTNHYSRTDKEGKTIEYAPSARKYTDWREMYDKELKNIDAVVITTPDHSHAPAASRALKAGKAVYCEKPLTWSIEESRVLATLAAEKKVATQMGNHGHAFEGNRVVVEWIRAGVIGDVQEVHTWTDRPKWPQGNLQREVIPVPENLNWDAWIGPAQMRPFHKHLHGFAWRGWFDFGCGAVGDMGCHTWDNVFWAMEPDYPTSVELLRIENKGKETFPSKSHFKWTFPAKGKRPGFEAHWYSGGWKPEMPEEYRTDPARQRKDEKGNALPPALPGSATIYIGTKGKILVAGDYAENGPRLMPDALTKEVKRPDKWLPRSPGHKNEFVMAAKGQKPWDFPGSNFATYAGPLTEVMLLGSISEMIGEPGFKIECDAEKRIIKTKEAIAMTRREYRKGWEL